MAILWGIEPTILSLKGICPNAIRRQDRKNYASSVSRTTVDTLTGRLLKICDVCVFIMIYYTLLSVSCQLFYPEYADHEFPQLEQVTYSSYEP